MLIGIGSPARGGAAGDQDQAATQISPCATGRPEITVTRRAPKKWKIQPEERFSGSPVISFTVDESGKVANVRVLKSSGVKDVDRWVVLTVRRWRYKTVKGCAPTELQMSINIDF
jgi:TonB family protein